MTLTAVLIPDSAGTFVAYNPEADTATQGNSVDEAILNLKEATELSLEEFSLECFAPSLVTTFEVAQT